ncbi:hypothetical protein Taro_005261 [Colocasia esculenta]|uniref:Uncharacterized protein n=1 Tax=Colocasia esculenta TaxID=4460 RepID=A0A843TX97_COLES|nr:hypothetical protein [Colocasia esculenta]
MVAFGDFRRSTARWFFVIPFRGQNPPRSVCTSTPTAVPSGRTRIFIRPGVGIASEAPIQNRHFDPVGKWSHSEISGPAPKFLYGSAVAGCRCDRIRTPLRSNTPSITRIAGGAHTRSRPITVIGSRVQLDVRSPPQGAGFAEFRFGAKIRHRSVCTSTPTAVPSGRTRIFIRPRFRTAREAPILNRHCDPVGKRSHSEISGPAPKFLSGSAVAGCRCDRIRTPLRSNGHNFSLGYRNRLKDTNSESALRGARRPLIASDDKTRSTGRWFHGIPFRGKNSPPERVY